MKKKISGNSNSRSNSKNLRINKNKKEREEGKNMRDGINKKMKHITKKTAIDIIEEAYKKGTISENEYERAIHKLLRSEVEGGSDNNNGDARKGFLIGELKIIQKGEKPEVILERGELELPTSAKIIKRGKEILVRVGDGIFKKGEKTIDIEKDSEIDLTSLEEEKTKLYDFGSYSEDLKIIPDFYKNFNLEREFEGMGDFQEEKVDDLGEVKEDIELIDLKREFKIEEEEKREKLEEEEKIAEMEEEKEKLEEDEGKISFLDLIPGFFIIRKGIKFLSGKKGRESDIKRLRRYALQNLEKIRSIKNEKRAIVGVAYVLKSFLEVRFRIPHELTYSELISEIKGKDINPELKESLVKLFQYVPVMIYAKLPPKERFSKVYSIAERTIKELTK